MGTLAAFVAGAATAAEVMALAEHLEKCANCRKVLDLVRRSDSVVAKPHGSKRRRRGRR